VRGAVVYGIMEVSGIVAIGGCFGQWNDCARVRRKIRGTGRWKTTRVCIPPYTAEKIRSYSQEKSNYLFRNPNPEITVVFKTLKL
jgi:hypothetical protein